jgi:hypothetical protein
MNDQRRRNEEMAAARNQFAAAVARGQVSARDRFNKEIKPGDKVMFKNVIDPVYTVISVDPVLDVNAPSGLMRVMIAVTYPVDTPGNQPHAHMVIVARQAPVAMPMPDENNGAGPEGERDQVTKDATVQDPPAHGLKVVPDLDEPPT